MKFTELFTKTSRDVPADEVSKNAQLLIRAGYIYKTMAGVYSFLPLGLRVLRKVEDIVRKHMNKIGSQEVLMNNLQPREWWEKAGNWEHDTNDALFHLPSLNLPNVEYALSSSNEENVTMIAGNYINSYKDLPDYNAKQGIWPLSIYHINTKFRDEMRAKAGLMRGREFRMKDMYDFHRNKQSQEEYFEVITQAYLDCFREIGLDAKVVNASGGVFSDKLSREFQVVCDAGEDRLFMIEEDNLVYNQEVAPCKVGDDYEGDTEFKSLQEHYMPGVIGVEELHKNLGVPVKQCTKTLFYTDSDDNMVVAVVRADREVSEEKLATLHKSKLKLANDVQTKEFTGCEIGYAGLYNLPKSDKIHIYVDNSCENLVNFECGGNKSGVHVTNVNWGRDVTKPDQFYDIKVAKEGDLNLVGGKAYVVAKGAEVGNIFDLGTRWTKALGVKYTDENNQVQVPFMGCHGLGVTRVIGVSAEIYSDDKGLKLPETIAPFKYHLITFYGEKENPDTIKKINSLAENFYHKHAGEVLWDNRVDKKIGMGAKLADADLIGCPFQVIITPRNIEKGQMEIRERKNNEVKNISI